MSDFSSDLLVSCHKVIPEGFQFDEAGIDYLENLLSIIFLYQGTTIQPDELFAPTGSFTSTLLDRDAGDPYRNMLLLQKMKTLSSTLQNISSMVDIGIAGLSKALTNTVHQAGIASLPDEILAYIFELAFDSDWGKDRSTVWISRVCRRYRKITHRTPHLWTLLSFGGSDALERDFGLYFSLSREKPLVVEIDCSGFQTLDELKEVMRIITPVFNRVEEFTIKAVGEFMFMRGFLLHLRENYNFVDFLALKTLRCNLWVPVWRRQGMDLVDGDELENDDKMKMFFADWHTPVLQRLELGNHIPLVYPISDNSTITSLHLTLGSTIYTNEGDESSRWDVRHVCRFLRRFKGLKELSMNFSYTEFDNFETLEVSLPRVSKVTFEVKRCEVESLHTLFGVLAFSQVKELDLVLDLDNLEDMHVWLSFLSTFMKKFTMETISHLSLEVRSKTETSSLGKLLECFPGLESLTLRGENLPLPSKDRLSSSFSLPYGRKLERLRIINSHQVNSAAIGWIETFQTALNNTLEDVQFIKCPGIDDEALRKIDIARRKLERVWAPRFVDSDLSRVFPERYYGS